MHKSKLILLALLPLLWYACEDDKGDYLYANEKPADQNQTQEETEDYRNTNRDIWQKPEMIIDLLGDLNDKTVADIGAGTGFFTLRLAQNAGKVIATDIDQQYIDSLSQLSLPSDYRGRVEPRLTPPDDPLLKDGEVDAVLIVNTFPLIENKEAYLQKLKKGIKPGGKLMIVDFKRKRTPIGPSPNLRLPLYRVEDMFYTVGFKNIQALDMALDYQWIIIGEV